MRKLKKILISLGGVILSVTVGIAIGLAFSELRYSSRFDGHLFFLEIAVALFLAYFANIIIHEGGHLVCGLISGYDFSSFRIGSIMVVKIDGKLRLRSFSIAGTGGQCLMLPPASTDGRAGVFIYNFGGVIFNVVFAVFSMVLFLLNRDVPFLSATLLIFSLLSIFFALTNGIPMKVGGISNDGMNAISLTKDSRAAEAFFNQLRMNEAQIRGIRLSDMPREWFDIPNDADMRNITFATIGVFRANRTMDRGDTITAEREINALLHSGWNIIDLHKNLLVCDLICCRLINGTDTDINSLITPELTKVMKAMKKFPAVIRTEYAIARLLNKNDSEAAKIMKRFETVAKSYPYVADLESERKVIEKIDDKAGQSAK
jgi:hypothetical protein